MRAGLRGQIKRLGRPAVLRRRERDEEPEHCDISGDAGMTLDAPRGTP